MSPGEFDYGKVKYIWSVKKLLDTWFLPLSLQLQLEKRIPLKAKQHSVMQIPMAILLHVHTYRIRYLLHLHRFGTFVLLT